MDRLYMPALMVFDLKVPVDEFARTVQQSAYVAGRTPELLDYQALKGPSTDIIGFPMTAAYFLAVGIFLMDHLHMLSGPPGADEGNEFLCCYGKEGDPAPADWITGTLLISDNEGRTWDDVRTVQFCKDVATTN